MVPICMGANPVFAVVAGLACGGYGILPGFIAGYIVGLIAPYIEKYLPTGLDLIAGALIIAPVSRLIAFAVDRRSTRYWVSSAAPSPQLQSSPRWLWASCWAVL